MPKNKRIIALAVTAIFTIAAFLFLGFKYTYHIHYQEQLQLFQFTCAYFADTTGVPGGFADWCGRFLIQFCYYARTGAAIIALLLAAVQFLTYVCISRKSLLAYALSFVPALLLFISFLDENAILGAVVSILMSLAAAIGVRSVRQPVLRKSILLAGVPLMYFLCGPLSVVYVLLSARGEKPFVWIAAVLLAAVCPVVSQYIFAYPLDRLIRGVHYYRYPLIFPQWTWLSALAAVLVAFLSELFKFTEGNADIVAGLSVSIVVAVLAVFLVPLNADFHKEELMEYDFMVQHRMWNRLMMKADVKNPDTPMSVSCLNLALAQTGRMNTNMFDYFQNGPDGLFPAFVRDCTSPIPTGEIFWHLGMVNTAQRFFFEAQEAIPDFQKSARCYKKLSETNIVNRDYAVAGKYLETLENTLFYRKWALNLQRVLTDSTAIEDFPEYVRVRELRFKEHDFLFSNQEMDSMLGLLFLENRNNSLAYDCLLAWTLLKKDLPRFMQCYSLVNYIVAPKHYQEAVLLSWTTAHTDFNGLPMNIEMSNAARMEQFIKAFNGNRGEDYMKKNFGDTYWFYYYYRNN